MTLQQEIDLAASRAYEEGYKKAEAEKEAALRKAEKEKESALKKAEMVILQNARKLKESGVSAEIISKCTGLPLEQVEAL